ncbi:MAG: hypothetical protein GY696_06160 [Gammaproteobacteria bacterium]|nr:hypothetical protein [Gammaproteobacteria bacterium]
MRDPDTWAGLWPTDTRDRIALISILVMAPVGLVFEVAYIVPHYVPAFSTEHCIHALIFGILLLNFAGNLYKLVTVDPSGRKSDLPSVLRPEWRYCYLCQLNAPPRAYHCPVCELCVLKRDHHR